MSDKKLPPQITMGPEVAQAVCNLKQHHDFQVFAHWLSGVADIYQHQYLMAESDRKRLQGRCQTFMTIFNAIDGAEAAREKFQEPQT